MDRGLDHGRRERTAESLAEIVWKTCQMRVVSWVNLASLGLTISIVLVNRSEAIGRLLADVSLMRNAVRFFCLRRQAVIRGESR